MKEGFSKAIRSQGDEVAFDHGQWEFQSRQLVYSANYLLKEHVEMMKLEKFEGIALLPTSQFIVSLAVELISKAYFLKLGKGNRKDIYSHNVLSLCDSIKFNTRQTELMELAESSVIWAGRYPTPKWTKESFKEEYDVPCQIKNGIEHIEANKMKNSSSPQRVEELLELYSFIRGEWENIT